MSPHRTLAEYVVPPEVTPAALTLEWHAVHRRVRRRKQVRAGAAACAVLAVVLGVGLLTRPRLDELAPGDSVATEQGSRTVSLRDGSQVEIDAASHLTLAAAAPEEIVLELNHGLARFDVTRNPARRFLVRADGVEVRVIGTRFTVRRDGRDVSVQVERGVVEVRDGEQTQRLQRGGQWRRTEPAATPAAQTPEEPVVVDAPPPAPSDVSPEPPPAPEPLAHPRPARKPAGHRSSAGAPSPTAEAAAPTADPTPPGEPPAPAATSPEPSPADTFAAAMRARAAGQTRDAIVGFQQVCERWPSSAYAPMSAFEWGRLALDAQRDPRQAARAFERTLELATSDSLIEDALARLTEAYARYDAGSCRRAQADYLRRFPEGPHVRGVTKACPP